MIYSMDIIPKENTESVQSSLDNTDREEMLWDSRLETLFKGWGDECKEKDKPKTQAKACVISRRLG